MKFKKDAEIVSGDFWYDMFEGGYIKPEKLLENEEDIKKVKEAKAILQKFKQSAEDQEILTEI